MKNNKGFWAPICSPSYLHTYHTKEPAAGENKDTKLHNEDGILVTKAELKVTLLTNAHLVGKVEELEFISVKKKPLL